jgi:hypothetical protein
LCRHNGIGAKRKFIACRTQPIDSRTWIVHDSPTLTARLYSTHNAAATPVRTEAAVIRTTAIVYRIRSLILIYFQKRRMKDNAHTAEPVSAGEEDRKLRSGRVGGFFAAQFQVSNLPLCRREK